MGKRIHQAALTALCSMLACAVSAPMESAGQEKAAEQLIVARPGGGAPLSLEACVERAVANNDAVRAERIRRRELDGQMTQAISTGLPSVEATGVWTRGRDPSFALDSAFGSGGDGGEAPAEPTFLDTLFAGFDFIPAPDKIPAQTYWRTSLNLNWTINPVRVLAALGAAGEAIRSQEVAIAGAVQKAELDVITTFQGIVLAAEQMAAVEARLANQREFLEIMRLRRDLALATALDTLQAAVAVANLEPQLRLARRGLRTAGTGLNAAMGVEPSEPIAILAGQVLELEGVNAERAIELADERPELVQLDMLGRLLEQNRRSQTADLRPFLALSGSYGLVGKEIADLDNKGHDFWSASVVLNIPLFNGLRTRGQLRESEAAILRTRAQREGLSRQVRVEVLDLLEGVEVARRNLHAAQLNVTRADELVETSKLMLKHGQAEYLTVLSAEAERAQAQTILIQARYDVLTTTASLKRAIGISPMRPLAEVPGLTTVEDGE